MATNDNSDLYGFEARIARLLEATEETLIRINVTVGRLEHLEMQAAITGAPVSLSPSDVRTQAAFSPCYQRDDGELYPTARQSLEALALENDVAPETIRAALDGRRTKAGQDSRKASPAFEVVRQAHDATGSAPVQTCAQCAPRWHGKPVQCDAHHNVSGCPRLMAWLAGVPDPRVASLVLPEGSMGWDGRSRFMLAYRAWKLDLAELDAAETALADGADGADSDEGGE